MELVVEKAKRKKITITFETVTVEQQFDYMVIDDTTGEIIDDGTISGDVYVGARIINHGLLDVGSVVKVIRQGETKPIELPYLLECVIG